MRGEKNNFELFHTEATLVRRLRPRKIHGCYKILDQLVLEILVIYVLSCLYSIVLYRATEDEFNRIKESK